MRHVFAVLLLLASLLVHAACTTYNGPITRFDGEHGNNVTKGKPAKLTAEFEAGGTAEIDNEVGAIESGATIETKPLEVDTTFTLTVTTERGMTYKRSVDIKVVAPPAIKSFKADKVVRPGQATTLTAVFEGGVATIDGLGAVESGTPISTGKLAASKTYKLTVTNPAEDKVDADAEAEAAVTPVIESFEAPVGGLVSRFAPMELKAKFTGGKGTIDKDVGPVKSDTKILTPKVPKAGGTYTLTVTNGLGEKVTKSVSVTTKKEMFVTNYDGNNILVFDADAQGDVPPKRILELGTGVEGIVSVVGQGDELFIANEYGSSGISVVDIASEGPVTPKRRITGATTGITNAYIISLAGGELFVADRTASVRVFDAAGTGNIAPKRKIEGAATKLLTTFGTWVSDGELYVSNNDGGTTATINVFPVNTTGNKAPTRTITIKQPDDIPTSLFVEANELFVGGQPGDVTVYNKKTGAQVRRIAGAATQLEGVFEASVTDGELFCASMTNNKIVVFTASANGNQAPKRVLAGEATTLAGPAGVYVY